MVISFVASICCQRRPAALTWLKRNRVPYVYGTLFRLASRTVVSDKPEDRGDGFEPQGGADRRVRADAQRNIDALLEAAKAVFATSGVDAPVREIAEKAGVGVGTVYRHFPQRARPHRGRLPSRNRRLRRRRADPGGRARAVRSAGELDAALRRLHCNQARARQGPALGRSRRSTPCPLTSTSGSGPPFGRFSSVRSPPARSAPMSTPTIFWVRSRAYACPPAMTGPATRGAWSLCWSTGYATARIRPHRDPFGSK